MIAAIGLFIRLNRDWLAPLAAGLAILAALWWLRHDGYQAGVAAEKARWEAAAAKGREQALKDSVALAGAVSKITGHVTQAVSGLELRHRTIVQPTILKETIRETRYRDPACALTDGVFRALNEQRASVNAALAAGAGESMPLAPLPSGPAAGDRGDGQR